MGLTGRRKEKAATAAKRRLAEAATDASPSIAGDAFGPQLALRRLARTIVLLVAVVVAGTAGYMLVEGWSLMDALYMTVITIASIGFEEVHDLNGDTPGRVLTMLLILAGVGTLAYALGSLVQMVVEGTVTGYFRNRRMEKMIDKLSGHYLVCGFGRVGREVAEELLTEGVEFVVVDEDPAVAQECHEHGYLVVAGNAADDAVLQAAGVSRAKGLIAAVDSDADNVFVVLSARKANPDLQIVARTDSEDSAAKLQIAGADRTLSPYAVGGKRLAHLAVHPSIVDYLDIVTHVENGLRFHLEELSVTDRSPLAHRKIGDLKGVEEAMEARILAIKHSDDSFNVSPSDGDEVVPGDCVIVLGTHEQIRRIEEFVE